MYVSAEDRQGSFSSLIQEMDWRQIGTKPLLESMLSSGIFQHKEQA